MSYLKRSVVAMVAALGLIAPPALAAPAEQVKGEIASEVRTGTTSPSGERVSADSQWTKFTVPDGFVINEKKTKVHVLEERGSEHSYELKYEDYTEVAPGTDIKMPRTILVKTHARSAKGPSGGSGKMSVKVEFEYVKFK